MRNLIAGLTIAVLGQITASTQIDAAPVMYTFSGTATGTVGNTPFTNAGFVIQAFADTSAVQPFGIGNQFPAGFVVIPPTTTITISGIGSGQFAQFPDPNSPNVPIEMFVTQVSNGSIGPNVHLNIDALFTFLLFESPSFATYDLKGPIGPVAGTFPGFGLSQFKNFDSTLGPITFTSIAQSGTFTAAVAEPASLVLLGTGAVALLGYYGARRRARPRA
jgi:hypothetical protein